MRLWQFTKGYLSTFICLVLPAGFKPFFLNILGHQVHPLARIGFSFIRVDRLCLAQGAKIGALNLIAIRKISMRRGAYIGTMNVLRGDYSVCLDEVGAIGNRNTITGYRGKATVPVLLKLGKTSKLTAAHYLNMSASIIFGDYSILAGANSQIWTHGFVHMSEGIGRNEVRGRVSIGDNVYIGSLSCIGPGISIGNAVAIGAHSSVSADLVEPGVYVSQKLRYIDKLPLERLASMEMIETDIESFHWRAGGGPFRSMKLGR